MTAAGFEVTAAPHFAVVSKMLDQLRDGDILIATKYDRLVRSLKDLLEIMESIRESSVGFHSLAEDIDATTPADRSCALASHPSHSSCGNGFPCESRKV